MIEVGDNLRNSREVSGMTLEEVSGDLDIPIILLEQIEEGNMGAFKDIFELKGYIEKYAKYIGLNPEEIIDEFNSFMFERTSKIPMDKIEKAAKEKQTEEEKEDRIASPYTKEYPKIKTAPYIIALIISIILMVIALVWSINQITIANSISYIIR